MVIRGFIILVIVLVVRVIFGSETSTNFRDIIEKGIETRDQADTLSTNDIPAKWRTQIEDKSDKTLVDKIYLRGDEKILEVFWRTGKGSHADVFEAGVYDGTNKIGRIFAFSGNMNVFQPRHARADYDMITSIKTNGVVKVMFTNQKGYFQVIELAGRDTHLMDDLEYTKTMMLIDDFGQPLVDAIKSKTKDSPRK